MADKRKKRTGRWDYLNDFDAGADGSYSYRGNIFRYEGERPYSKERLLLCLFAGLMTAAAAAAGIVPAPSMLGFGNFYVVPLYIIELVGVFLTAWAAVKLIAGGSELRSYVYEKSAAKIPHRCDFTAIAALLCIPANVVYLCLNGFGGKPIASVLLPVLHAAVAVTAMLLKRTVLAEKWTELKDPKAAAVIESAFSEAPDEEPD